MGTDTDLPPRTDGTDLLPPNSTPQERALSKATERALLQVPTERIRQLWSPYDCPADILPWLAWSLSVEPWQADWPEERKREAIAASVETHRIKGTLGALKRALSTLDFEVEIDERTGAAYTFRLLVDVEGKEYGAEKYDKAEEAAIVAKNARSALLGVDALIRKRGQFVLRPVVVDGQTTTIYPNRQNYFAFSAPAVGAIAQHQTFKW